MDSKEYIILLVITLHAGLNLSSCCLILMLQDLLRSCWSDPPFAATFFSYPASLLCSRVNPCWCNGSPWTCVVHTDLWKWIEFRMRIWIQRTQLPLNLSFQIPICPPCLCLHSPICSPYLFPPPPCPYHGWWASGVASCLWVAASINVLVCCLIWWLENALHHWSTCSSGARYQQDGILNLFIELCFPFFFAFCQKIHAMTCNVPTAHALTAAWAWCGHWFQG